ncbi:hypothetical protein [Gallaecimonas xiamenensis]|uniref:Uncharacterized protein n=1 Tax=Gallaecimonas xiamenensis 3-C-1 TaxID=745411 RepID=K2K4L7_9GAMM|nr:hypothetical protein [Gallaecimonas xiamenensis]EKE77884.1 hypothetical protein B3C1_00450 [Gallaecimonas xiamenensis 3-C-1]
MTKPLLSPLWVQLDSSASLAAALAQYRQLLDSHQAFEGGRLILDFRNADNGQPLSVDDLTINKPLLERSLALGLHPLGETLLFAAALVRAELHQEVVATAQAMVAYSRRVNDSALLLADHDQVFGAEALYVLARVLPQYSYLLGHFFTPSWDSHHYWPYRSFLYDLLKRKGWERQLIQAYLWCDNGHFRRAMYAELSDSANRLPSLAQHLQEHPEDLGWFKDELKRRLLAAPMLLSHRHEELNPVLALYQDLDSWDQPNLWHLDHQQQATLLAHLPWLDLPLAHHAQQLLDSILSEAQYPLTAICERERQGWVQDKREVEVPEAYLDLLTFVGSLPDGAALQSYVETGDNSPALDNLAAFDFAALEREQAPGFYDYLDFWLADEGVSSLTNQALTEAAPLLLAAAETRLERGAPDAKDQYLRLLDIVHRLLGRPIWPQGLLEQVIKPYQLLEEDAFVARYPAKPRSLMADLCSLAERPYQLSAQVLARLLAEHPRELAPAGFPDLPLARTYGAYLLAKDAPGLDQEAMASYLAQHLAGDLFQAVLAQLRCQDSHNDEGISDADQQRLALYLAGEGQTSDASHLKGQLLRWLHPEAPYSDQQPGYRLLAEAALLPQLAACYWLAGAGLGGQTPQRFLDLLLYLAPQYLIASLVALECPGYQQQLLDIRHMGEPLLRLGVPRSQWSAFTAATHLRQALLPGNGPAAWQPLLALLDNCAASPPFAEALFRGLGRRSEQRQWQFQLLLHLRHPQVPLAMAPFWRALGHFIQANLADPDWVAPTLEALRCYIEGQSDDDSALKALGQGPLAGLDQEHLLSPGHYFWLLPKAMADRLATLLLNHSLSGYQLVSAHQGLAYARVHQGLLPLTALSSDDALGLYGEQSQNEEALFERLCALPLRQDLLLRFALRQLPAPQVRRLFYRLQEQDQTSVLETLSIAEQDKLAGLMEGWSLLA